jgi:hypothetical protein
MEVAHSLGEPVPSKTGRGFVDELTPLPEEEAQVPSLSRIYGLGALPFHIDTAHWVVPCRYVLMSCNSLGDGKVLTMVVEWSRVFTEIEQEHLATAVFLVRNGRSSFYASALDHRRRFLRYDPGCMTPVSRGARDAMVLISERTEDLKTTAHAWSLGDLLVIDNWRALHGRADASAGRNRRLRRVLVKG